MEYGNITTDDDVDMDDCWRCPDTNCNLYNHPHGPPQCGCGEMKPGWDCCSYCESYGPMVTFHRDVNDDTICHWCLAKDTKRGKAFMAVGTSTVPLYLGALVLLAIAIVLVLIMGMVD